MHRKLDPVRDPLAKTVHQHQGIFGMSGIHPSFRATRQGMLNIASKTAAMGGALSRATCTIAPQMGLPVNVDSGHTEQWIGTRVDIG
jgi:hypothetical protein